MNNESFICDKCGSITPIRARYIAYIRTEDANKNTTTQFKDCCTVLTDLINKGLVGIKIYTYEAEKFGKKT